MSGEKASASREKFVGLHVSERFDFASRCCFTITSSQILSSSARTS